MPDDGGPSDGGAADGGIVSDGGFETDGGRTPAPDFTLTDVNTRSETSNQEVTLSTFLSQVVVIYFASAG